jgi:hypothetical protein
LNSKTFKTMQPSRFFKITTLAVTFSLLFSTIQMAQTSIAREWNEIMLEAIRRDFARPTIHARNLFHTSVAMYDIWAAYEKTADTYFLGKTIDGFYCGFLETLPTLNMDADREKAISFAMYRLMKQRFINAPFVADILDNLDAHMQALGYDINNISTNYHCGAAEFGNYVAAQLIAFGLQDGSNEADGYANQFYEPANPPLRVLGYSNPTITDFNRWQPLSFDVFVDQGGNASSNNIPNFLSPEWGQVSPFALKEEDLTIYNRDDFDYWVYHDPGTPPLLENIASEEIQEYQWGHTMVSVWGAHLTPDDGVIWDISPASIGNIQDYPTMTDGLQDFYNFYEGGDQSIGHSVNPTTGQPYEPQLIKRGDYARVLAEFWADGPDSETPPGHWFTILNYVNDQPDLVKKIGGAGEIVSDLEWDVKAYFTLGGAMHDAAIAAWGIKGWYDYIRPVSAIRGMAKLGQSTDPNLPLYDPRGLPLYPGFVELATYTNGEDYLRVRTWLGHDAIENPAFDYAGVDWIDAKAWRPYQRSTFVTPPFAGYVSGHSTYSRAAAEVLTAYTGDSFFPGGMGEFYCQKNAFLVFEDGPSEDVTLQWATYRDASDQCSLSRIWGGIHPPADDMPGRLIGHEIGLDAYAKAVEYFDKTPENPTVPAVTIYPNPTDCRVKVFKEYEGKMQVKLYTRSGQFVLEETVEFMDNESFIDFSAPVSGMYILVGFDENGDKVLQEKIVLQR